MIDHIEGSAIAKYTSKNRDTSVLQNDEIKVQVPSSQALLRLIAPRSVHLHDSNSAERAQPTMRVTYTLS